MQSTGKRRSCLWDISKPTITISNINRSKYKEAQAGQSKADFIAKIYISCKEARETLYWIRILIKTEIVSQDKLADLADEAKQLVAILTTITKSAQANK